MLDARFSHLYFYQSLNRLQRGLSAIAELLVLFLKSQITKFSNQIANRIMMFQIKSLHRRLSLQNILNCDLHSNYDWDLPSLISATGTIRPTLRFAFLPTWIAGDVNDDDDDVRQMSNCWNVAKIKCMINFINRLWRCVALLSYCLATDLLNGWEKKLGDD